MPTVPRGKRGVRAPAPLVVMRMFYWRVLRGADGEICQGCGRPVANTCPSYWTAPDDLWLKVEGQYAGIRCIPCFTRDCRDMGLSISWMPDATVKRLVDAMHPVLAAHRSDSGHVTGEQITAAWAAYDDTRRVLADD